MSPHPSEDDLVLDYYGESEDAAVRDHVAGCADCAARRDAVARVLDAVDASGTADVPDPGPDFGRRMWDRLRSEVMGRRPARLRRWAPLAAAAGLVLAAFLLGRWSREHEVRQAQATAAPARERVLLVAVGDHLERSQMVLVELENASGNGVVDISMERQLAQTLLPDNRLYRQAAQYAGESGVASVLDELERLLVEVAASPDTVPRAEVEDLRRRMEEQGILFKLRVVGSEMRERGRQDGPRGGSEL
jgi:hypothetical protein